MFETIEATTIGEAYDLLVRTCIEKGKLVKTSRDEAFGEKAYALWNGRVIVTYPMAEPMHSNKYYSNRAYCEKYAVEYLILSKKTLDEDYTYGYQFHKNDQMNKCIKQIREAPWLRSFCLEIGEPSLFDVKSPPCMRYLWLRQYEERKWTFNVFMRSWDILGASNANMIGFLRVAEHILHEALGVDNYEISSMIVNFGDAHIYERQFSLAKEDFKYSSVSRLSK